MIETGDYVDIRFQDKTRYYKPVGIYWLQAAVVKTAETLGVAGCARARSGFTACRRSLGAIGAVLATYWCALAFVGRRGAVLAALMMMGSIMLGAQARIARTDAMLLLAIVAAMAVLARAYLCAHDGKAARPGWALVAVFWTALAAGVLLKGLVILMIVGLTAATLSIVDRSVRWLFTLRPLYGVVWLVVLVLPWFIAIYARTGDAFLSNSVIHDTLGKIADAQESHGGPPGYYLVLVLCDLLSRLDTGGTGGVGGMGQAAGGADPLPPGMAGAGMAGVRNVRDQAAALRAAALSGHRHPHRRRGRSERAVAAALGQRRPHLVVARADSAEHHRDRGRVRDRPHPRPCGLAVPRRRDRLRFPGLAALR